MSHNLCKEYPSLSPFDIDEMSYCEVISIYAEVRGMQISDKKEAKNTSKQNNKIYVPASDNWY
jgi:hypothetical protein